MTEGYIEPAMHYVKLDEQGRITARGTSSAHFALPQGFEKVSKTVYEKMTHLPTQGVIRDTEGNIIDIVDYPDIPYTVDSTTITASTGIATITSPVATLRAIIDGTTYEVTDGVIEYSNENIGTHFIRLYANGYKPVEIAIEVAA